MRPTLRHVAPSFLALLFTLLPAAAGCGGKTNAGTGASGTGASDTGGSGAGGDVGTGGDPTCHIDPPGSPFTFQVENDGTQMLRLAYGCSASLPIVLDTPKGDLGISPGPANTCEFSCDAVYKGMAGTGLLRLRPRLRRRPPPGATVSIAWDRRVYKEISVPAACMSGPSSSTCALAEADADAMQQKGTLTVCTDTTGAAGSCDTSKAVTFTVDTTQPSATISVK